jgi:hypothetical protein
MRVLTNDNLGTLGFEFAPVDGQSVDDEQVDCDYDQLNAERELVLAIFRQFAS